MSRADTLTRETARLRRIQLGARATLTLGIGASLAANVLAADPSITGRVIAAWSPVALLLTVELLSRVPVTSGRLSRLRVAAATVIAGIAAWVSYWHMVEVAEAFGEATIAAHVLPFSVDGLVVVASVCLMEISDRLATLETTSRRTRTTGPATTTPPTSTSTSGGGPTTDAKSSTRRRSTPAGARVLELVAEHPEWTQAQVAEAAGCSVRTVRRHLTNPVPTTAPGSDSGLAPAPVDGPSDDPTGAGRSGEPVGLSRSNGALR